MRAYERGGAAALSILTEAPLRRLARRPARGARGDAPADPAQGLHRRPLPGLRGRGRRRRRAPADRRRAAPATTSPCCCARRAASTSTCSSRSTTRRSSSSRWTSTPSVLGINNRDLPTSRVDLERTFELLADVPAGKMVVSESGISTREQLEELERVGVDAVLVGETLMRAHDIEAACRELAGGGDRALAVSAPLHDRAPTLGSDASAASSTVRRRRRRRRRHRRRAARRRRRRTATTTHGRSSRRRLAAARPPPAAPRGGLTARGHLQARRARRRLHPRADARRPTPSPFDPYGDAQRDASPPARAS